MPRATSKGDNPTSREMVDRFSLANGTAVQIHWPSNIEASERFNLTEWLCLMTRKILASIPVETGFYDEIQTPPDWREQRDRTKAALSDRMVDVPKPGASLWDTFPGGKEAYIAGFEASPPPPASELRQYFNGCPCAECVANYGVAGVQYVDATMPGYDEHMAAVAPHPAAEHYRSLETPLYFQGCKCGDCKANRATGQLVWEDSANHRAHIARVHAAEIAMLERSNQPSKPAEKTGEAPIAKENWF